MNLSFDSMAKMNGAIPKEQPAPVQPQMTPEQEAAQALQLSPEEISLAQDLYITQPMKSTPPPSLPPQKGWSGKGK